MGLGDQWLQRLADCLAGWSATTTCAQQLESSLDGRLPPPAPTSPIATALHDATAQAGQAGQVVTSTLVGQLQDLNARLGGALQPLLSQLNSEGGISVDVRRLAPALLTPEVTIQVAQRVTPPGANLVGARTVTVTNRSTARRAFKDAVIVPSVSAPGPDGTVTFDPNPALDGAAQAAVDALSAAAGAATPAADQALRDTVCLGVSAGCPTASGLMTDQLADLRDIASPSGPGPDTATLIANAVASGEPVILATAGYATDPHQLLGSTVYSLPGVAQLLPGLLFVPALDVVPVVLSAGPLGKIVATPIDTVARAAQTRGLYRARLVD